MNVRYSSQPVCGEVGFGGSRPAPIATIPSGVPSAAVCSVAAIGAPANRVPLSARRSDGR